jgi:hypothetical protein
MSELMRNSEESESLNVEVKYRVQDGALHLTGGVHKTSLKLSTPLLPNRSMFCPLIL